MGLNDRERAILYKTCVDCLIQFDPNVNREKAEVVLANVIKERCRKWEPEKLEELISDINEEYMTGQTVVKFIMEKMNEI